MRPIADTDRLIFALDVPDADAARALVDQLGDAVSFYKVGLELAMAPGYFELVDWLKLLMADELAQEALYHRDPAKALPPMAGALVKNEQDTHLLERLAFMMRRQKNSGR